MLNMNELRQLSLKSAGLLEDNMPNIKAAGYGKATGLGAGAGALAGVPVGLLAHALMAGEDKRGLRDYLKSGLLGSLIGGGVGAAGGAAARAYLQHDLASRSFLDLANSPAVKIHAGLHELREDAPDSYSNFWNLLAQEKKFDGLRGNIINNLQEAYTLPDF